MKNMIPIILFVYNRLPHSVRAIEALKKNNNAESSELFIYSDGPKNNETEQAVMEVRKYIKSISGFKNIEIIERSNNLGLANSIISGVTEVINKYKSIIVLEDDLVTSPYFLNFMNNAIEYYKNNKDIFSIGGYCPPIEIPKSYANEVYLTYRCCSWGWATWQDRWQKSDWDMKDYKKFIKSRSMQKKFNRGGEDLTIILKLQMKGKLDSWAIRWDYAHYKNNGSCVRPVVSLVKDIGTDGSGTHCTETDYYEVELLGEDKNDIKLTDKIKLEKIITNRFATFYDGKKRS